jgi:hypothetical protein
MSYGDYVEQLKYLLFLKMANERTKPPYLPASGLTASRLAQAGANHCYSREVQLAQPAEEGRRRPV